MRLSEAILLGSISTKKISESMFNDDGGACAMGAALYAIGVPCETLANIAGYKKIQEIWPWTSRPVKFPDTTIGTYEFAVWGCIWRLNDICGWSRERIAEWISTIEPPESADAAVTREREAEAVENVQCGQETP